METINFSEIVRNGKKYIVVDKDARERLTNAEENIDNVTRKHGDDYAAITKKVLALDNKVGNVEDGNLVNKRLTMGENINLLDSVTHDIIESGGIVMVGATVTTDGREGDVPKPTAGESTRTLHSDGSWRAVTASDVGVSGAVENITRESTVLKMTAVDGSTKTVDIGDIDMDVSDEFVAKWTALLEG